MAEVKKIYLANKLVQTIVTNTTLDISHQNGAVVCANVGGAATITIPPDADVAFPIGTEILVSMATANPITIAPGSGVTIASAQYGNSNAVMAEIRAVAAITKIAVNTWGIAGQLGKQVETFIPIDWAEDGSAAPAAAAVVASGTGSIRARNFDAASDEDVIINWRVPNNIYEAGLIKFKVHTVITNATGPSSEGFSFQLSGFSLGTNDGINGTYGAEVTSEVSSLTASQYDVVDTDQSGDVTITDLARDEVAMLKLHRDTDDATDDYAQDVGVTGITIYYYERY